MADSKNSSMARHWHVAVKVATLLSSPFLVAAAYRDTVPIIAWTSYSSHNLDALSTYSYSSSADLLHRFLQLDNDEICSFETIMFVDQPGLSAADLKTSLFLIKQLSNAPSFLQIPYLPSANSGSKEFESFKESLAEKCKSDRQEITLGSRPRSETGRPNQIMGISMPPLDASSGGLRRQMFAQSQHQLEKVIKEQTSSSNSYLIIYTSSVSIRVENGFDKAKNLQSQPIQAEVAEPVFNSTLPAGSLLERYRFFTTGILIGFFIGFVVLLPILLFGIYALASIQTPSRTDTVGSARTVSLNKKNQ